MDLCLDTLYRGYCGGTYTFRELVRSFSVAGVSAEECEEAGYEQGLIRALAPRQDIFPSRTVALKLTPQNPFSVRPAYLTDREELAKLERGFLLELNGRCDREDLSDVDALLLYKNETLENVGALWHEVLGNDSEELYVRGLFTDSSIRTLGGGRALITHALTVTAPEGGFRSVGLDAPAHVAGFYRRLGFRGVCHSNTRGMYSFSKKVEY